MDTDKHGWIRINTDEHGFLSEPAARLVLRQSGMYGWRQWTETPFSRFCGGTKPKFPR